MRVLDLGLQIDGVGKTGIQQFDEFGLGVFREIDTTGKANIRFGFCRHNLSRAGTVRVDSGTDLIGPGTSAGFHRETNVVPFDTLKNCAITGLSS